MVPARTLLPLFRARLPRPTPRALPLLPRPNALHRPFSQTSRRADDQSRAKAGGLKETLERPEITPLFLFTGAVLSLGLFFGFRHLFTDAELELDHHARKRLETTADQLDFESMKHVAEDPEGKLTKEGIRLEHERQKRREQIKQDREEKEGKRKPDEKQEGAKGQGGDEKK